VTSSFLRVVRVLLYVNIVAGGVSEGKHMFVRAAQKKKDPLERNRGVERSGPSFVSKKLEGGKEQDEGGETGPGRDWLNQKERHLKGPLLFIKPKKGF